MLTDKFLEQKKDEQDMYVKPKKEELCENTPLNRVFAFGCCIVVLINVGIWLYIKKFVHH